MFIPTQSQSVISRSSSVPIIRTTLQRINITSTLCHSSKRRLSSCLTQPKKTTQRIVSQNTINRSELQLQIIPIMSSSDNDAITDIEELHRKAILDKQSTYIDPSTGFTVFTELAHLKRGKCCGNMCRHCPYGYANVQGLNNGRSHSENNNALAKSGDREGTALLVGKIMDGTYYDYTTERNNNTRYREPSIIDQETVREIDDEPKEPPIKGKGGRSGGTFTAKNVPYTRKGDTGTSQLFTGETRSKDDVLFEAMGTVDELCCIVGTVYAELMKHNDAMATTTTTVAAGTSSSTVSYGELPEQLLDVMSRLFDVGSHIARPSKQQTEEDQTPNNKQNSSSFPSHHVDTLEEWIDTMTEQLPELTSFILPTGSPASASLHVARTVCRRAERRMVPLIRDHECCDSNSLAYVNRLSDYLFTAARYVNYCEGKDEVQYRRERGVRSRDVAGRERVVVRLKD